MKILVFQKKKSAVRYEPSLAVPQTYEVRRNVGAMPIKAKEMLVVNA